MLYRAVLVGFVALVTVLCVLRIAGVKDVAYQAIAHVTVGLCIGYGFRRTKDWAFIIMAGVMTAVEVAVFVVGKLSQ